jgi:succinate dehydrogenase / fumarate reductase cytochrome b subunit
MNAFVSGLGTSVGTKFLMALTGIILFVFTIGHMVGNLQVFAGPEKLNAYAKMLQSLGPLLWVIRLVLLATLVVHVWCALSLTRRNRAARPVAYAKVRQIESTYASRTMMMTGLILLAFIVYHLAHFTLGITNPDQFHLPDPQDPLRYDVWRMMILGFRNPVVAGLYVVAMLFLGLHLMHGAQSFVQSMGWNHRRYRGLWRKLGLGLAALVVIGNIAMPLVILLRLYPAEGVLR